MKITSLKYLLGAALLAWQWSVADTDAIEVHTHAAPAVIGNPRHNRAVFCFKPWLGPLLPGRTWAPTSVVVPEDSESQDAIPPPLPSRPIWR